MLGYTSGRNHFRPGLVTGSSLHSAAAHPPEPVPEGAIGDQFDRRKRFQLGLVTDFLVHQPFEFGQERVPADD